MWKLLITGFAATLLYSQTTPPWSRGANDPATNKGYVFQVAAIDNIPDLHGNRQARNSCCLSAGTNSLCCLN